MRETPDRPESSAGGLARSLTSPGDNPIRTLAVAFIVSFCCAVLVAGTAIFLRPQHQLNQELNRQQNILAAAGFPTSREAVRQQFENVESRVVDLATGNVAPDIDPETLIGALARADSAGSVPVPRDLDIASIKERPGYAVVYLLYEADRLSAIVLPVYGYGLWSTLYGYIALEGDGNTIIGLRFYDHAETPGLGGEIDDPQWQRLWRGKRVYGESGEPLIEVIKGRVLPESGAGADHQVDGITGATLTGQGVTNLLRYWLGEQGFGPYLRQLREDGEASP